MTTPSAMSLKQLLDERISVRKFSSQRVPQQTIEEILQLAQRTPSWCNIQPWHVLIASGNTLLRLRERFVQAANAGVPGKPDFSFPPTYQGAHRDRRRACGLQLYQSLGIGKDDRAAAAQQALENFRLFDAPHLALITVDDYLGFYGALDCGLYLMSFMLAAQSLGVDTIAQASLASYPDIVRAELDVPPERKLICGVSFGYALRDHPIHGYRTARAPLSEAVQFFD